VSSILRALKKLEDAPPDQNGIAPWQDKFTSQHVDHEHSHRNLLRSAPGIVAAVAVLALVGWFATRGAHSPSEVAPRPAAKERTEAAQARPSPAPAPMSGAPAREPYPSSPPPVPPRPSADSQPAVADQRSAALPPVLVERLAAARQQKLAAARAGQAVGPTAPTPVTGVVPPTVTQARSPRTTSTEAPLPTEIPTPEPANATTPLAAVRNEPASAGADSIPPDDVAPAGSLWERTIGPPARPTTPVVAPSPASAAPATVTDDSAAPPAPVLNRLRDPGIKLQAIAWSSDPDRRMAMINEQIVHEGQTIEGYTIAAIGEESVTMRKGSEAWELRYGH
jgi:hypothetical protein